MGEKMDIFFNEQTAEIQRKALEALEREGCVKDAEGFFICPKCGTRKSHYSEVLGYVTKCDCECITAKKVQEEEERQRRIIEERRFRSFDSKQLCGCTFESDNNSNPKITKILKAYVENFDEIKKEGRGLILIGKTGTGKSFFAGAVGNALIDNGYRVRQTNFFRLESEMSLTYDKQAVVDSYAVHSDLVILDDLGTERDTSHMRSIVFSIIDTLYSERTPFIVTTNITVAELLHPSNSENVRVYQRILERCTPIVFENESQRPEIAAANIEKDRLLFGI